MQVISAAFIVDGLVKSRLSHMDGLWKKFDIRGVVFCATIRQYIWYGALSRKTYNEVDRAFYEPILVHCIFSSTLLTLSAIVWCLSTLVPSLMVVVIRGAPMAWMVS